MISFSLILYVLTLLIFGLASFFALYQLWQFGYEGDHSKRVMIGYIAVSIAIILISLVAFFFAIR